MPWAKGQSGNPGGQTLAMRRARELVNAELTSVDMLEAWRTAYLKALNDGNPAVIIDFANRVAGKPREHVEVTGEDGAPLLELPEGMTYGGALLAVKQLVAELKGKK